MKTKKLFVLLILFSLVGLLLIYYLTNFGRNYSSAKNDQNIDYDELNLSKENVMFIGNLLTTTELVNITSIPNIEHNVNKQNNENITFFSPNKVTDRYSYYFGTDYLQSYGLAQKSVIFSTLNRSDKWRELFPDLMHGISASEKLNPNQTSEYFTSEKSEVMLPEREFQVGDNLVATIQAKDRKGRKKLHGGDYFRARIVSGKENELYPNNAIKCSITDHNNGTYSVTTPLLFGGNLTLDVTLISSVESIKYMLDESEKPINKGFQYLATLVSNEIVECNWYFSELTGKAKEMELCDYGNPRNQEPWICTKPKSGICHKIKYVAVNGKRFEQNSLRENVINRFPCHTKLNSITISVHPSDTFKQSLPNSKCTFKQLSSANIRPNGFFRNKRWQSLLCDNRPQTNVDHRSLLNHKQVFLLGDSTTRQILQFYQSQINLKEKIADLGSEVWHRPRIGYSITDNTTIYYRAHGPPLRNPGQPLSRHYISDELDSIDVGGRNVSIVFNIGLHIFTCHASMYIHRIEGIREAVVRLIERHPETKIIFRLPNANDNLLDWFMYRQLIIAKHIFKNVKGVLLLDFWDLTNLWLLNDNVHPNTIILTQEINFLSQIIG